MSTEAMLAPLITQVWLLVIPFSIAMAMGTLTFVCVAKILRKRLTRSRAIFLGEAAGAVTLVACLWAGYVTPHGGTVKGAYANLTSGASAQIVGAFSDEPRCRWLTEESRRLNAAGLSAGQAAASASALRQKAADTFCLAGVRQEAILYPSMSKVEGYMFRVKDGEECRWAKVEFMRLAAKPDNAAVYMDIQAHKQRTEQASCFRY